MGHCALASGEKYIYASLTEFNEGSDLHLRVLAVLCIAVGRS